MKSKPVAAWKQLAVSQESVSALKAICRHAKDGAPAGRKNNASGKGLAILFTGSDATAKMRAAAIIAKESGRELRRVDLSAVVSKYVGETEKHLSKLFVTAERKGAILFFDEADALFGKRSDVKDSHDRYANTEIDYLLQRVEASGGLAILTTNIKNSIDAAFSQRFNFIVDFPFRKANCR